MIYIILTSVLLLISLPGFGQGRNIINPLGALPMEYNSSFAGQAGSPRFNSSLFLGLHPRMNHREYSTSLSYDQFIPAIASGIGVTVMNYSSININEYRAFSNPLPGFDLRNSALKQATMIAVAIAPKISISGKYTLSPSIEARYHNIGYDSPPIDKGHKNFFSTRAALLFNSEKFYAGYSVDLFSTAPSLWYNYFESYLQTGYTFRRSEEAKFSFTPQVALRISNRNHIRFQQPFTQSVITAINFNFQYKQVSWGFNNTGLHLGWQNSRFRCMASGWFENTGFGTNYSGNLSMRYIIKNSKQSHFY
jgi:hypothetical protein